jgi:1,2-diacylglycerol 3-alpha-glucosyltransferase
MNIGLFTDTYFPQVSGVSTSVKVLSEQLIKDGHNVYIFTTTDPKVKKTEYGVGTEKNIYRFSSIPFAGFKDRRIAVRGFFEAVDIARVLRLDIVHTQTEFSLGMTGKFVARQLGIPLIHTYHTMYQDYTHYVVNGRLIKPSNVKTLIHSYLKSVQAVVAPSDYTKDVLLSYGVRAPISVIPTGISFPDNVEDHSDVIRKRLKIAKDSKVVLSLGRVAAEKSIPELISSFSNVLKSIPKTILIIAGDGPDRLELEEKVNEMHLSKNIKFVGMVNHDEVFSYYKLADVFASPSTTETQGITFIESMNAGTPYIAKPNTFLSPITKDVSVGTIVNDENELTQAIVNYLSHPEFKADNKIREKELSKISAEAFANKIIYLYEDVIKTYKAPHSTLKTFTTDEKNYLMAIVKRIPQVAKIPKIRIPGRKKKE